MMPRRTVVDAAVCAIIVAVLAIIGALWVIWQAISLVMPFLILIDGR